MPPGQGSSVQLGGRFLDGKTWGHGFGTWACEPRVGPTRRRGGSATSSLSPRLLRAPSHSQEELPRPGLALWRSPHLATLTWPSPGRMAEAALSPGWSPGLCGERVGITSAGGGGGLQRKKIKACERRAGPWGGTRDLARANCPHCPGCRLQGWRPRSPLAERRGAESAFGLGPGGVPSQTASVPTVCLERWSRWPSAWVPEHSVGLTGELVRNAEALAMPTRLGQGLGGVLTRPAIRDTATTQA